MKFSTFVLLGAFILSAGISIAQDTDKEITTIDLPTNVTTSTVAPITTLVPDKNTTTSSTTSAPTTTTTLEPNTTTTTTSTTEKPTTTSTTTLAPNTTTSTTEVPTTSTLPPTTTTPSSSTTVAPQPPTPHPSHWSTTSFIGGMVFAFGMGAIGFVAWKFYKSRNERNYHTL